MSVQLKDIYLNVESDGTEIDCIQENRDNITKITIILTRLTKLLIEKKLDSEAYINFTQKYIDNLQKNIEMRVLYTSKIQNDFRVIEEELETVLEKKELLQIRKKIGDLCDEEYEVKLRAIEWDINNLNEKQSNQKKCLNMLQGLSNNILPEELEMITNISKNIESAIENMELDPEISERLKQNNEILTKITQ